MTCDDGSGEFTLREISSIPIDTTWTITGGAGYDSTSGEGDIERPLDPPSDLLVWSGTGTITRD